MNLVERRSDRCALGGFKMRLQCPRCGFEKTWERERAPDGPGDCACGAWAPWKVVLKDEPNVPGFVRVVSDKGWQELAAPLFRERKDGWKKN